MQQAKRRSYPQRSAYDANPQTLTAYLAASLENNHWIQGSPTVLEGLPILEYGIDGVRPL
jgi:hypothetical protein